VLPWTDWPAAQAGRGYGADGNAYFNRSGPRIVEWVEFLAGCLHPDRVSDHRARYQQSVRRIDRCLSAHS
jgi:iron complex transport system substrate-binding protein